MISPIFVANRPKYEKRGNSVTNQTPEGVEYQRNSSKLKPYNGREAEPVRGSQGKSRDQQMSEVIVQESAESKKEVKINKLHKQECKKTWERWSINNTMLKSQLRAQQ